MVVSGAGVVTSGHEGQVGQVTPSVVASRQDGQVVPSVVHSEHDGHVAAGSCVEHSRQTGQVVQSGHEGQVVPSMGASVEHSGHVGHVSSEGAGVVMSQVSACSQFVPWKPPVHLQTYPSKRSWQVALFTHGDEAHSSVSERNSLE